MVDNELLFLYSENSRAKIRDLAAMLKKSPQRLKYSLKSFEKEKVVSKPHCVFDYSFFGLILFRVYFKGGYISDNDKAEIIQKLNDNPYIVSIYELTGGFDLVIEIAAPNPSRFNKELKKVAGLIPTLSHYKIILNVVTHLYPRAYLIKEQSEINPLALIEKDTVIGGDRIPDILDKNETKIIKQLLINPKLRLTTLAKQSGINVKTANQSLKDLKKRKIVRGFKYVINTEKLNINSFRLFLNLHNLSKERENEFNNYLLQKKEIVQMNKTVGDWDMELDIESFDKYRIRQVIIDIRNNFKDLIENFNIIEFYCYHKKTYLPMFLFEQEKETSE